VWNGFICSENDPMAGFFECGNERPWTSQRGLCSLELNNVTDSSCTGCRFRFSSEFLTVRKCPPVTSLRSSAFETGNHKMCKQKYQATAISVSLPSGAIRYTAQRHNMLTLCLNLYSRFCTSHQYSMEISFFALWLELTSGHRKVHYLAQKALRRSNLSHVNGTSFSVLKTPLSDSFPVRCHRASWLRVQGLLTCILEVSGSRLGQGHRLSWPRILVFFSSVRWMRG
jgi:hypothetical protein